MDTLCQIIAIGGGGFGRNPKQNKIEKYILDQSGNENPDIVFIPTARAEDKGYIVNFYSCFSKFQCKPSHINFFQRTSHHIFKFFLRWFVFILIWALVEDTMVSLKHYHVQGYVSQVEECMVSNFSIPQIEFIIHWCTPQR